MKNKFFIPLLLAAATLPLGRANAIESGTANWTGVSGGDWTNPAGWSTSTAPATGGGDSDPAVTRAIRINLNNGSTNTLIYSDDQGHTIYTGQSGRVMGSTSASGGSMTIRGGIFDSRGSSSTHDVIGYNGNGGTYILTLDGGTYTNVNGGATTLILGYNGTQTVRLDMKDGDLITGALRVGWSTSSNINATINLDGGTLTTGSIAEQGTTSTHTSTINFNDGTLQARGNSTTFIATSIDNANILSGGAKIDSNGFNITIPKALTGGPGDGGLTKLGAGTLTFSDANTYTGATTINAGTLSLASTGSIATSSTIDVGSGATLNVSAVSGWTVGDTQTLTGTGTVNGNTTIEGILSPGNSPGTLTFGDNLTVSNGATYLFEGGDLTAVSGTLGLNEHWTLALGAGFQDGGSVTLFAYGALVDSPGLVPNFDLDNLGFTPSGNLTLTNDTVNQAIVLNGISVIPEPSAALLGGLGLLVLLRRRR